MEQLSAANTRFALDLFRALNESNPAGNIFISPMSISSALAMVFLGTRGTTAAQVSKVSRNGPQQPLALPVCRTRGASEPSRGALQTLFLCSVITQEEPRVSPEPQNSPLGRLSFAIRLSPRA